MDLEEIHEFCRSIKSTSGKSNIRSIIGVYPQFDILWNALSAQEHLYLFASIKGIPRSAIKSDAENLLSQVKLTESAHIRAGSYNGGIKRHLSVARISGSSSMPYPSSLAYLSAPSSCAPTASSYANPSPVAKPRLTYILYTLTLTSIKSTSGKSNIRSIMGVCPQFDILWNALSAREHLYLFASIKGIPRSAIKSDAKNLLSQVKLSKSTHIRAGSYNGGMKRCLSVAIALIGVLNWFSWMNLYFQSFHPVYAFFLDFSFLQIQETTGMDPVTRRYAWDIFEHTKKDRAIVLTTHSMEEADILSDRIAIMARGKLRCIGTLVRLKSRFGTGFVVNVTVKKETRRDSLLQNVSDSLQREDSRHQSEPKEDNKAYIAFIIPHEREEQLTDFFAELQDREEELGIINIQLSLATLEEVFLNNARQAEVETAAADGSFTTLNLRSRTSIQNEGMGSEGTSGIHVIGLIV